ncbi:MAG: glycosyltransferase [Candidatus Pelethousia sp.]|nr:glycosyltransferase [Candidatus Pelethousia sp.]
MKILILTCNTGEGHNASARAIKEVFESQGCACDIVDSLSLISERASLLISNWHTKIYRHLPKMFEAGYSYTERHPALLAAKRRNKLTISPGVTNLYKLLVRGGYDAIICVHVFSATAVSKMRRKFKTTIPSYFVATDYTCSPSVAESGMDLYFIPHGGLLSEFHACGLPAPALAPVGIPIRQAFYEKVAKGPAKALLGLPPDKRNVLLMCGSMGCGPMEALAGALADALPADAVLSVVCGTNERLRLALEGCKRKNVFVVGFTDKIPLLMDSADVFLTKPGGISISEAASKGLPMLLIDAVGGCESRNLRYFLDRGWAQTAEGTDGIVRRCLEMLGNPERLERHAGSLQADFSGNPAMEIFGRVYSEGMRPMRAL